jgi:hypothetical protein
MIRLTGSRRPKKLKRSVSIPRGNRMITAPTTGIKIRMVLIRLTANLPQSNFPHYPPDPEKKQRWHL